MKQSCDDLKRWDEVVLRQDLERPEEHVSVLAGAQILDGIDKKWLTQCLVTF